MSNPWRIALLVSLIVLPAVAEEQPAIESPPAVTMHMNSMNPRDVLADFTKQTGATFEIWPQNLYSSPNVDAAAPMSIDVTLDGASFWAALDAICSQAQLMPVQTGNQGMALQVAHGMTMVGKRPQSVGPLATVVVESLARNHSVSLDQENPQAQKTCNAQLMVYADPRIRVLKFRPAAAIETAEDECGQSIVAGANPPDPQETPCRWKMRVLVPLDYDPQTSHRLAKLKGSVRVTVPTEIQKIEFENLDNAQGAEKEAGGIKVTCQEIKPANNSLEMKVTIVPTEMSREDFRALYGRIFNDGKFITSDGKALQVSGGGGGGEDGLTYTLQCNFQDPASKPVKLVWEFTTQTQELDLPFEFHDLPLP